MVNELSGIIRKILSKYLSIASNIQEETKNTAFVNFALYLDAAAMTLHKFFTDN